MRARSLDDVAHAVGGERRGEPVVVRGVTTDSRTVAPGDLFVARIGEQMDGHDFVPAAFEAGASGAMVARGRFDVDPGPVVEVTDTGDALLALARDERSALDALVVGITGSTGKTCTKDFVAAVLGQRFRTAASRASFNNEVGLPLTILSTPQDTEALVCEMGARRPGHIRRLCQVALPRVGVVTNVGVAHLELFGSPEALRNAKAELPESLPEEGAAVLNADDPVVRGYEDRTRARTVLFGVEDRAADVRAERVSVDRTTGRASFDLVTPAGRARVELPVPGEHMVPNALAAAAVGWFAGVEPKETARGLAGASMSSGRMQVFESADGVRVIDDAYNANPTSMAAALRAARWMAGAGRCVAVLGHMAELGPIAEREHERVGELVARLGIDELVTVGQEAVLIAFGAEREGVEPERIHRTGGPEEALDTVRRILRPGDLVLVKASRVVRLERLADALRAGAQAGTPASGNGAAA